MKQALADEPLIADAIGDHPARPLLAPLAGPHLSAHEAVGLDLILEGFLMHRGRPRALAPADRDRALLLGDYCYARGLVRVAGAGDLYAISALSELIATSTGCVADEETPRGLAALWRATVGAIAGDVRAREDLPAARAAIAAGDATLVEAIAVRLGIPSELHDALEPAHEQESAA